MRCIYCNQNEATKTYQQLKNGKNIVEYYCMECYHRLFLSDSEAEEECALSACPYCGTSLEEFQKTKLVGCAYCYKMMASGLIPAVLKMQGESTHRGKMPPLSAEDEEFLEKDIFATQMERGVYRADAARRARFERQCQELEIVSDYLREHKDYDGANSYEEKLSKMRAKGDVEEEFVWRKR
ncbi:MAG: hypothetical protein IKB20_04715 [Clostridia bacterium]|nr:hypothetical protein [Clostridia bacterium]